MLTADYKHPSEHYNGGVFIDNGAIVAFDNSTNDATCEEFNDLHEAIKYASGELAITKNKTCI